MSKRKIWVVLFSVLLTVILTVGSIAVYTDRVQQRMQIQTATFNADSYELSRTYHPGPYYNGQTADITISEKNTGTTDVQTVDELIIEYVPTVGTTQDAEFIYTMGGLTLKPETMPDGKVKLVLPKNDIVKAGSTDRVLKVTINTNNATEGHLNVDFNKVTLKQQPKGYTAEYDHMKLNTPTSLKATLEIKKGVPMLAPQDTWYKGTTPRSNITEISIVDRYTPVGAVTEQWDASDPSVPGTVTAYIEGTKLTIAGNGYGKIYANPDSSYAFSDSSLTAPFNKVANISGTEILDLIKTTNTANMFSDCSTLQTVNVANWNMSSVTDTHGMFENCSKLSSVDVSKWDIGKSSNLSSMFKNCQALNNLDVSKWNTSSVMNLAGTFEGCKGITTIDVAGWNTSSVTDMSSTFKNCSTLPSLALQTWDVRNVKTFSEFCSGNTSLTTADLTGWNTASATNMKAMFTNNQSLTSIPGVSNLNTSKVTNMGDNTHTSGMFQNCSSLSSLNLSGWDTSSLTTAKDVLLGCDSLQELTLGAGIKNYEIFQGRYLNKLTTINFLHDAADTSIVMPVGGVQAGAFYVDHYIPTTINTKNPIIEKYDWVADNRARLIPMFAPQATWYKGTTPKANITEVNIVDSYTPAGTVTETWDASDPSVAGTLTAYVEGSKLTIAGNGSGIILGNPDSASAFAKFTNTGKILGAERVDYSKTYNMNAMFQDCTALNTLNVSNWKVDRVYNMSCMFQRCPAITTLDVSQWNVGSALTMGGMFDGCSSLASLDVSRWNTSRVQIMAGLFARCSSLKTVDVSSWNTGSATNTANMFMLCDSLNSLDVSRWDTSNMKEMRLMFKGCFSLPTLDVSRWDMRSADNISFMFDDCRIIDGLDVGNWTTGTVTDMAGMFRDCHALKTVNVSNWNTASCLDMGNMFMNCKSINGLDVSRWQTGKVTHMGVMFGGCSSLTGLDVSNWNTGNVTNMAFMFSECPLITDLNVSNWNTSSCTDMEGLFRTCSSVTTLDVSNWDTSRVTKMGDMFDSCTSLTALNAGKWNTSAVTGISNIVYNCPSLVKLDMSNWDTRAVIDLISPFGKCTKLQEVKVGTGLTANVLHELPIPNPQHIPGATYKWFAGSDGTAYEVSKLPVGKADTYYAVKPTAPVPMFATQDTWYKGTTPKANITEISIVDSYNPIGSELEQWDASDPSVSGTLKAYVDGTRLIIAGNGSGEIKANTNATNMFNGFSSVQNLDLSTLNTNTTTNTSGMFNGCSSLTTLNMNGMNTGSVTQTTDMFAGCNNLKKVSVGTGVTANILHSLPTPNPQYISGADGKWYATSTNQAYDVANIPGNVTETYTGFNPNPPPPADVTTYYQFTSGGSGGGWLVALTPEFASALANQTPLGSWKPGDPVPNPGSTYQGTPVTDMTELFSMYNKQVNLDLSYIDSSNVVDMTYMFNGIITNHLDLSPLETSKVTSMQAMFSDMNIPSLDLSPLDTSSLTNTTNMFSNTEGIKHLDVSCLNMSKVNECRLMFSYMRDLESVNVSGWNTTRFDDIRNMFQGCIKLKELDISSWDLSGVPRQTRMNVFIKDCTSLTKAYARTQRDCDWLNADADKPPQVTWTVKPAALSLDLNGGSVAQNNDLNLDLNGGQVAQNRDLNLDLNGGKVVSQTQP